LKPLALLFYRLLKFPLRPTPSKLRKSLPAKPDNSEKHEGEERTEALKRIAGLTLQNASVFAFQIKNDIFLKKYFNCILLIANMFLAVFNFI